MMADDVMAGASDASDQSAPAGAAPHLRDLYVYPLKGAGGVRVERMPLDGFGPRHDRRWMVVDPDGVFVSQREEAKLALVRTAIEGDVLVLSTRTGSVLRIPAANDIGPRVQVRIWSDTTAAVDTGDDASDWLSETLGRPLRLVYMPDDSVRPVHPSFGRPGDRVGFADAFPFLLLSQAALGALNGKLAVPLPMNRFRPNLVVDGVEPHAEDGWKRISIGDIALDIVKPCARCLVTTTDQATGERGVEPLRTLATYRKVGSHVMFGQNAIHRGQGTLRVGDAVRVLERAPAS
jgi:hypothetical protein